MKDAEKIKPFYEKLGLEYGTIEDNNYDKSFDYHILYSTITGFEFAFLREGISGKEKKTKNGSHAKEFEYIDSKYVDSMMIFYCIVNENENTSFNFNTKYKFSSK